VTRNGVFGYLHVEPGPHLLVVNGPGVEPLAARFSHEGGLVRAGDDGDLTAVANEDAGWIRGDARETNGVVRVRVIEDYAGVVYDGEAVETDRFAVAVHREGRYTVEVTDRDGRRGAYRVTPASFGDGGEVLFDRIRAGKLSLTTTLRDELDEVYTLAESLAGSGGIQTTDRDETRETETPVLDRLRRATRTAAGAVTTVENGDREAADEQLRSVVSSLEEVRESLASERQSGYGDSAVAAIDPKVRAGIERATHAIDAKI